jgi:hypothetical protein
MSGEVGVETVKATEPSCGPRFSGDGKTMPGLEGE